MALLAAETKVELFRAVEAWCPVSDLVLWHEYLTERGKRYIRHIEACTGGLPKERLEEYLLRSPSTHPEELVKLPVSIHHGRHDPIVPFRHSVLFAQKLEALGSDQVYLDIFDGGHEQIPAHSFEYFSKLVGKAKTTVEITG